MRLDSQIHKRMIESKMKESRKMKGGAAKGSTMLGRVLK